MTDNLSRITDKIISDAREKADLILAEASTQREQILAQANVDANGAYDDIISQAQADSQALRVRIESEFNMKKRSAVLNCKQELINKAYSQAMEYLQSINRVRYVQMITGYVTKSAQGLSNDTVIQLTLCSKDSDIEADIENSCKKNLPGYTIEVSDNKLSQSGGVIIRSGDIIQNYTFEAIIDSIKDSLDVEVSRILFSRGDI